MKLLDYILKRLKERSTWLGLISIATALGITLSAEQRDAILAAGVSMAGLVTVFTQDKK